VLLLHFRRLAGRVAMTIDRRTAILIMSAASAALLNHRVKAQAKSSDSTWEGATATTQQPTFMLALDDFAGFVVRRNGKDIKITGDEIWEALGGAQ
jgi:hypothetical protein